jgi:glycosyltransferase involved in cell wall biosynthesis
MIQVLLKGQFTNIRIYHVRLSFAKSMADMGKFRFLKILRLLEAISLTIFCSYRYHADILYYPPSGPNYNAMIRDMIFLIVCRRFFKKTVLHFHASGISTLYSQINAPTRFLFRKAFFNADLCIRTAEDNIDDSSALYARNSVVIHNGLEDYALTAPGRITCRTTEKKSATLLYVGVLSESKGIFVLLQALRSLVERGRDVELRLVGEFDSDITERRYHNFIAKANLQSKAHHLGVLEGAAKFTAYREADIFCFPSHFESESFGLVLVEAMQFGLPIVATRWRGIPSIVQDGKNGFLVPVDNPNEFASKADELILHPSLREQFGRFGRASYEANFRAEQFYQGFEDAVNTYLFKNDHGVN